MNNSKNRPLSNGVARVPVMVQREHLECGAVCLAMVAAYYKKWVPAEQVRIDCGVSRDGSTAGNIVKAAKSYGFEVKCFRRSDVSIRQKGVYPCIAHWNNDHFVVLKGFSEKYAYINDPAEGSVKLTLNEFAELFSGTVIMLEPGENFTAGGRKTSMHVLAGMFLSGSGGIIAAVAVATFAASLLTVSGPAASGFFIDRLLTQGAEADRLLLPFAAVLTLIAALRLAAAAARSVYGRRAEGKLSVTGGANYMWKVMRLPARFFSQHIPADIFTRLDSGVELAYEAVNRFIPLSLSMVMTVIYLVLILRHSVPLAAVSAGSVALNVFIARLKAVSGDNSDKVIQRYRDRLFEKTFSGVEMIETIKASGAEQAYIRKWAALQADYAKRTVRAAKKEGLLEGLSLFASMLVFYIIMVVGVGYVVKGRMTLGVLWMLQGFFSAMLEPLTSYSSSGVSSGTVRTKLESLEDIMNYQVDEQPENSGGEELAKLKGTVELRNVTFGYSKLSKPIISDFSLRVEQGACVALTGASGCGKSTVARLISGLYEPWEGEILLDGVPRGEIDSAVLTGSLAVAEQETVFFDGTVRDNIRLWDRSIEDFESILAARDAQLHECVMARGGYDSPVSSDGRSFSGGERQRLEIARVLAGDPSIIIFDEATSALDAETEEKVISAVRARGITLIMIVHKLSAARDCDEIFVMDKGAVAERGTHEELMRLGGLYAGLALSEAE